MKLSICMMVKDEAKNLDRCLNSMTPLLKEIDSELIIVDTGSTDNTVEIAKKYTQNIYLQPWFNDFSGMRNISINYGKGEWILIIDADEEIQDCHNIIEFLNSKDRNKYSAIALTVKNFTYENKHDLFVLSPSPRLFKNDGYFHYEGTVHNEPKYDGFVKFIDVYFLHYGYIATDKELVEKKFKRTGDLLKAELEKDPENIYYRFQLSVTYESHGDNEKALEEVKKAFELMKNKNLNPYDYIYLYLQMAQNLITNKMFEEAKKICIEGIELEKENLDLYFYLAMAETMLGNTNNAIEAHLNYFYYVNNFDNLSIRNNGYVNIHTIGFVEDSYYNIAVLYFKKSDFENAIKYIKHIKSNDYIRKAIELVIQTYIKTNQYNELFSYYSNKITQCESNVIVEFLVVLESDIIDLIKGDKEKKEIYQLFSKGVDKYSQFNRARIAYLNDSNNFNETLNEFLDGVDFYTMPDFYGDIFYYMLNKEISVNRVFSNMSEESISKFMTYTNNNHKDFVETLFKYIMSIEGEKDFPCIRTKKTLERYILIILSNSSDDRYIDLFNDYIKNGITYMKSIYKPLIYEQEMVYEVKSKEEIFFIYIYLAYKNKESNILLSIKYMEKALHIYPIMNKGIDILLNEFNYDDSTKNKELEDYKVIVKKQIKQLIYEKKFTEAQQIIKEYEDIVKNDIEIILFKSQIALKEANSNNQNYKM